MVNGETNAEVDEYVSCIEQSDREFSEFIEELRNLDQPVIVCLFGDHQPGFADMLAELSDNTSVSDMDIDQVQQRYITPYLIWTNDNTLQEVYGTNNTRDLSLNYLAANMLKTAGLPLNEYFAFMLSIENELPAVNLNGYQDALGRWYWHDEESEASTAYQALAIVQHDNLFDRGE